MPLGRRSEKRTPGSPQPRGSRVSPAHHGVKTGRSRPELLFGLALISMIFIVQVAIIGTWTWLSEVRAQRLYENSLTSLEQVTRIARDIDRSSKTAKRRPNPALAVNLPFATTRE